MVYNYRQMEAPNNFPCWDLCPGSAMCAHGEQGGLRAVPQAMSCFLQLGHPWPVSQPLRDVCLSHFPLPIWGPSSPPGHPTMDLLLQAHPHVVSLCLLPPQLCPELLDCPAGIHPWLGCSITLTGRDCSLCCPKSGPGRINHGKGGGRNTKLHVVHGISQPIKRRSRRTPKTAWTVEGETTDKAWLLWMEAQINQRSWTMGQPGATSHCRGGK